MHVHIISHQCNLETLVVHCSVAHAQYRRYKSGGVLFGYVCVQLTFPRLALDTHARFTPFTKELLSDISGLTNHCRHHNTYEPPNLSVQSQFCKAWGFMLQNNTWGLAFSHSKIGATIIMQDFYRQKEAKPFFMFSSWWDCYWGRAITITSSPWSEGHSLDLRKIIQRNVWSGQGHVHGSFPVSQPPS